MNKENTQFPGLIHWSNAPDNVYACNSEKKFEENKRVYVAYTDGSCDNINEPHAGGAAYVIMYGEHIIRAKNKGLLYTTNNRAEMLAIVSAVCYAPANCRLDIYTDSQYAMNIMTGKWGAKINEDLLMQFDYYAKKLRMVVLHWVKGHNGHKYNEMVDDMAWSAYKDIIDKHGIPENKWEANRTKSGRYIKANVNVNYMT